MDNNARMTDLCRTLPLLLERPGFGLGWDPSVVWPDPDDDTVLPEWGQSSNAAAQAVVFVRHVWNAHNPAPSMAFWDARHRNAFASWAAAPWWC